MKGQVEVLHELLAETLSRLDAANVGILAGRKNNRNANGKAEGERRLTQQLS